MPFSPQGWQKVAGGIAPGRVRQRHATPQGSDGSSRWHEVDCPHGPNPHTAFGSRDLFDQEPRAAHHERDRARTSQVPRRHRPQPRLARAHDRRRSRPRPPADLPRQDPRGLRPAHAPQTRLVEMDQEQGPRVRRLRVAGGLRRVHDRRKPGRSAHAVHRDPGRAPSHPVVPGRVPSDPHQVRRRVR
jgi:hypothetical protein